LSEGKKLAHHVRARQPEHTLDATMTILSSPTLDIIRTRSSIGRSFHPDNVGGPPFPACPLSLLEVTMMLFFKDHLGIYQWVMYFPIWDKYMDTCPTERSREGERRRGRRTIGLDGAAGIGEGEVMVARTSGSMQRRRWTSHRLQRLLLIGLGKEVRQLRRQ
jgi:hypothetical protein